MNNVTTQPAIEDPVVVPRGLLGSACSAIQRKRGAPKTLERLRRYTTGDLSTRPVPEATAAEMLLSIVAAYEAMHKARMEHETEDPVPGAEQRETHQRLVLAILMDKARKLLAA
ncbi:MAG: hypothetical protein EKK53_15200 [Burkholderiales bacterium]|nr:MAG: hypothetical protein EKK53_15200 [Burkholderiales bacterium]